MIYRYCLDYDYRCYRHCNIMHYIDKIFGDYSYQVLGDIELDTARTCIQRDIHQ